MKVTLKHIPHIANRIAIGLNKSGLVTMTHGLDGVSAAAAKVIEENVKKEIALEERVNEIVDENEEQIDFYLADERQLFFMIKKKMAPEFGVIMNYDDRYNDLAHLILDELYENYLAEYDVNENQVRNVIFKAFKAFANAYDKIDTIVYEKIKKMKKEYIVGSLEYEIIYEKLYEEELKKRGMI